MMGERTVEQSALFYEFSPERHVPQDHLLRSIDRFVDLSGIREHLRPYYSEMGRPSVDPELMIRMLLIGYTHGIRSERRLCEEVHLNLAYRWFCRLGLDGTVPDHSTFEPRTGTAAFATVTFFASCSRRRLSAASPKGWSAATALPSMRRSSAPRLTGSAFTQARKVCHPICRAGRSTSTLLRSTMPPSVLRARSCRRASHLSTLRRATPRHTAAKRSSATPPTTLSM